MRLDGVPGHVEMFGPWRVYIRFASVFDRGDRREAAAVEAGGLLGVVVVEGGGETHARRQTQLDASGGGQDVATASPGGRQGRSGSHEDGTAHLVRAAA